MPEALFNWTNLLEVTLVLTLWWGVLTFFRNLSKRTSLFGRFRDSAERAAEVAFLLFEPLAFLVIIGVFIFINPPVHGLMVLTVIFAAFPQMRNYLSGRIVRFDKNIAVGKKINTKNVNGIIAKERRLGLAIKTNKGIRFVNYSVLLKEGYMLLADDSIGGFYRLRITPKPENEIKNHLQYLRDLMVSAPYPDRNRRPDFALPEEGRDAIVMQISVMEKAHLAELRGLIEERGYQCRVLKK